MGFLSSIFGDKNKSDALASQNVDDVAAAAINESNSAYVVAEKDIDATIAAHEDWTRRLIAFVNGTSHDRQHPETDCLKSGCLLGSWLQSSGKSSFGQHQSFTMLLTYHQQFHVEATQIVRCMQLAQFEEAIVALNGSYARINRQVIWLLKNLKNNLAYMDL